MVRCVGRMTAGGIGTPQCCSLATPERPRCESPQDEGWRRAVRRKGWFLSRSASPERRQAEIAQRLTARHTADKFTQSATAMGLFCPWGRASWDVASAGFPALACPSPANKAAEARSGPGRLPKASRVREVRPLAARGRRNPDPTSRRLMKRPSRTGQLG